MFGGSYFGKTYFGGSYFGPAGTGTTVTPAHGRRHRVPILGPLVPPSRGQHRGAARFDAALALGAQGATVSHEATAGALIWIAELLTAGAGVEHGAFAALIAARFALDAVGASKRTDGLTAAHVAALGLAAHAGPVAMRSRAGLAMDAQLTLSKRAWLRDSDELLALLGIPTEGESAWMLAVSGDAGEG